MKVGTDGVLLGAWADYDQPYRILEVGTGSGLIALMLAQRFPQALITTLEIDPQAHEQAEENFRQSPWADRLTCLFADYKDFESYSCFDLIVSNPPYHREDTISPITNRALARSSSDFQPHSFFNKCFSWLKPGGRLQLILPLHNWALWELEAQKNALFAVEIVRVRGQMHKPAKRILCTFEKTPQTLRQSTLILEKERHQPTPIYRQLCKDFYLHF